MAYRCLQKHAKVVKAITNTRWYDKNIVLTDKLFILNKLYIFLNIYLLFTVTQHICVFQNIHGIEYKQIHTLVHYNGHIKLSVK